MSRHRKRKNLGHALSVQRKEAADKELSHHGLNIKSELQSIGIFFDHLDISHSNYIILNQINQFCNNNVGIDINIFAYKYNQPCINILCPVLGINKLDRWQYPIITTSLKTTLDAVSLNIKNIYYYAFDPEFNDYYYSLRDLDLIFHNNKTKIFVRHNDHKKLIETEFDIKIFSVIPDYDFIKIIKIIMEGE